MGSGSFDNNGLENVAVIPAHHLCVGCPHRLELTDMAVKNQPFKKVAKPWAA